MSTFVNAGLISLNKRFNEVDLILKEAEVHFDKNEPLYDALCRSAQVLLSAHFEGYLKDLIKNALDDINNFSSFSASSPGLQRRLCEHFVISPNEDRNSKVSNEKIKKLQEVLSGLDIKFKKEYFSYDENANPKATILDKYAEMFGIKNFFNQLKKSRLDLVFSNTKSDNDIICVEVEQYLLISTMMFPYSTEINFLGIDDTKSASLTLWDDFLSGVLKRRHDIAHGRELENSVHYSVIESDIIKIRLLVYAFTLFVCIVANPVS
ncbi:HEPN domain-containing protein [Hymenobacter caeli]|uniref:RiboL-PSP-HEPN domain-containing protein n=1 Tax=Hymenobacter caeli TaxID=2735894 RepID=A0ABX2FT15_9BACT|nr:HEPN domain-containing protein [Hymenobacter caeli]NRT20156.1 hypothetical protein [Hymenobacter caeli]